MKFLIVLFAILLGLTTACKPGDKFTQFDIEYNSSFTVSSGASVNVPINLFTPDVETNSESTFEVNDTRKDKIQEILLTSLLITVTAPNGKELDFLKEIEIFISANGLNEVLLASKYNIQNTVGVSLLLDPSLIDFKEYIKKDEFTLRVRTVTDEAILQDVDVDIRTKFYVDAKLIGKA